MFWPGLKSASIVKSDMGCGGVGGKSHSLYLQENILCLRSSLLHFICVNTKIAIFDILQSYS